MSNNVCPVCEEGHLTEQTQSRLLEHNDAREEVSGFKFSLCDSCGTEIASSDHTRTNKRLVLAFRKRADGLLAGNDVRRIRADLGLSQQDAAKIFGGGTIAFSKYENDDVSQSVAMDRLLRVAAAIPEAYHWLYSYAGLGLEKRTTKLTFEFEWRSGASVRAVKHIASEYGDCTVYESHHGAANTSRYEDAAQSA